jgi:hypothetical protein
MEESIFKERTSRQRCAGTCKKRQVQGSDKFCKHSAALLSTFMQTQINLLHCLGTCLFAKFQFSWHHGFGQKGES